MGLVLGALMVLLVAVVIVQNRESAELDVFWWAWSTRLWLVMAVAVLIGIAVGLLLPRALQRHRAVANDRELARETLSR